MKILIWKNALHFQLQLIEAHKEEIDDKTIDSLYQVQNILLAFFIEILDEFKSHLSFLLITLLFFLRIYHNLHQ